MCAFSRKGITTDKSAIVRGAEAIWILISSPESDTMRPNSFVSPALYRRSSSGHAILCSQGEWGRGGQTKSVLLLLSPPSPGGCVDPSINPVGRAGVPVEARPGFGRDNSILP